MCSIETATREQKGIKAIAQSSGDKIERNRCDERIKKYQDKYAEISEATGIEQDKKRMTLTKGAGNSKINNDFIRNILYGY